MKDTEFVPARGLNIPAGKIGNTGYNDFSGNRCKFF
jgi:hypothetical protein